MTNGDVLFVYRETKMTKQALSSGLHTKTEKIKTKQKKHKTEALSVHHKGGFFGVCFEREDGEYYVRCNESRAWSSGYVSEQSGGKG